MLLTTDIDGEQKLITVDAAKVFPTRAQASLSRTYGEACTAIETSIFEPFCVGDDIEPYLNQ